MKTQTDPLRIYLEDMVRDEIKKYRDENEVEKCYKVKDVQQILSLTESQVRELIKQGKIRSFPIGSKGIRVPASAIREFIKGRMQQPKEATK